MKTRKIPNHRKAHQAWSEGYKDGMAGLSSPANHICRGLLFCWRAGRAMAVYDKQEQEAA